MFASLEFDVVRSQGTQGQVTVDVMTVPGNAIFSVNSSRVVLAPISQAVGAAVSDWCQVSVANTTYLVMITSLTSDTQLSTMLPAGSPVEVGQSVIYKWQGQLSYASVSIASLYFYYLWLFLCEVLLLSVFLIF